MRYQVTKTNNGFIVKDIYKGKVVSIHRDQDDAEDVADYKNEQEDRDDHEYESNARRLG